MEVSAHDIAKRVNGTLTGNGDVVIRGAAGLAEATEHDISFLRDEKKKNLLKTTKAAVVIVPAGIEKNGRTLIHVENPIEAFSTVLQQLADEKKPARSGIHPQAQVSKSAHVGKNVYVGPFCIVEDDVFLDEGVTLVGQAYVGARSKIGEGSLIYPQVIIREDIIIGKRCLIHPGAVIGADGYGFYFARGKHNKIPQVGTVLIEDDVEIGAGTAIDRATTGATRIGQGTKIDNLVHIAHNVTVGENSLLVAQVGVAGSSTLGKGVVLGGQAGISDHMTIGDGAQLGGQTGVIQDVQPGAVLFGTPAQPVKDAMKQALLLRRLPELFDDVKKLKEISKP